MSKLPWTKWYASDWLADTGVRSLSYAARGLLIDMLSLMLESPRRGFLMLGDDPMTPAYLAKVTNSTAASVTRLLAEIDRAKVLSRTEDGVYFSRRIVREVAENSAEASRKRSEYKAKTSGFSPGVLRQTSGDSPGESQKSEARGQNPEARSQILSPSSVPQTPHAAAPPEPPPNAERERPPGFDPLIDNARVKALCDNFPPSRGGRAYGVAARAVQVLADEKYGGDCNAATAFLAARVAAWAASAKGRDLAARGFMPAFGNWLRDKCYDEPDADWANVPVADKPNGTKPLPKLSFSERMKLEGKL